MSPRRTPPGRLSDSELRVVREVARGGEQQAAADRLGLTYGGVKSILRRARLAVGAKSTAHLVTIAIRTRQLPADVAAGTEVSR